MDPTQLWQAVLSELELAISKANFTTWFRQTFIRDQKDGKITVAVPNTFTQAWLQKKYHSIILHALQNLTDHHVREVSYLVETKREKIPPVPLHETQRVEMPHTIPQESESSGNFNTRYTFENFIVGKGNELAHAACAAVAQKPGFVYNPLFIYGGVGLGKTHLLQAIGHSIIKEDNKKKILYVSCERFTNEFIHAVRNGRGKEFKDIYRNVDVLLIDDIQFITGKEGTQEEFFHTFNTLHQSNRQIVLSSDRPPKAIPALEQRLLSRFEWGMIADVASPDLETRIAILEAKCQEKAFELEKEIVHYIATLIQHNIRELEGALNRLIAYHQLNNTSPSLENTKAILATITAAAPKRSLHPRNLIQIVADFFEIRIEDLTGASRKKELVVPRQITMYLMREEIGSSYPSIGHELGGRDHTTAMHAYSKIKKELENNERLKQDVLLIKERVYQL